jgi:hypothetical protein
MKPRLCKPAIQLREQVDDCYPSRLRDSDGWIGDLRHSARKSDHNPDAQGWVRAIDIDADLAGKPKPELMPDLVDQVRLLCKSGVEKRIAYIIFDGFIYSSKFRFIKRKYTGSNKHTKHAHFSFKKAADNDGSFFQVPMLGGTNDSGN